MGDVRPAGLALCRLPGDRVDPDDLGAIEAAAVKKCAFEIGG